MVLEFIMLGIVKELVLGNICSVEWLEKLYQVWHWKLKAEKQIQHILLMERITSHQQWPQLGRNLWETFYEPASDSTWTHLT